MRLNFIQSLIIVCMVALATQITRWTPFLVFSGSHGLPEAIAVAVTAGLHLWKRSTLLSILVGTAVYMLLVQLVFV